MYHHDIMNTWLKNLLRMQEAKLLYDSPLFEGITDVFLRFKSFLSSVTISLLRRAQTDTIKQDHHDVVVKNPP